MNQATTHIYTKASYYFRYLFLLLPLLLSTCYCNRQAYPRNRWPGGSGDFWTTRCASHSPRIDPIPQPALSLQDFTGLGLRMIMRQHICLRVPGATSQSNHQVNRSEAIGGTHYLMWQQHWVATNRFSGSKSILIVDRNWKPRGTCRVGYANQSSRIKHETRYPTWLALRSRNSKASGRAFP